MIASRPILSTNFQGKFLGFFKKLNIFDKVWVPYLGGIFEMRMDKSFVKKSTDPNTIKREIRIIHQEFTTLRRKDQGVVAGRF